MRGEATAPKSVLYVRIPPAVDEALRDRVRESGETLSAVAARTIETGLLHDSQAVYALLGWCWQMCGWIRGHDGIQADAFAAAIKRAEVGLGIRRADERG